MDDVDGALFSRLPVGDSENDFHQSNASLLDGFSKIGNYSRTDLSTGNKNRTKTGPKPADEIIKRESVPVFRSVPPQFKGSESNLAMPKTSNMSCRVSAPCELNDESTYKLTETGKTHTRTGNAKRHKESPLVIRNNDQKNKTANLLNSRLINSSDCLEIKRKGCFESKKPDKANGELQRDISPEVTFSTSKNNDSSSSFGDIDSNWGDDLHVEAEVSSASPNNADNEIVLRNQLVSGMEKRLLIEPDDNPSRASSMFYLNEDGTCIDTNDGNVDYNPDGTLDTVHFVDDRTDKNNVSTTGVGNTGIVDYTDANCQREPEAGKADSKTEKLVLAEALDDDKMAESHMKVKRQRRVVCRVVPSLIFPVVSLVIYIWDIGSDIKLAAVYKEQGDINLFWITLACIVVPLILMSVVDVSWLWLDRPPSTPSHIIRYILGVFTLGRIARSFKYMWHIVMSNTSEKEGERNWHKDRAIEEKRDCYMLDFINAFAESVPQLFVQLYLMYAFNLELTLIRVLNILSSWASIAWTYSAYYRCNRESVHGKQDLNAIGFTIFLFSVLSALAARVICVVLFLVYFPTWIGCVVLAVHFILALLWIVFREDPELKGTISWKFAKYLYCAFFAYVSLLCFLNLRNSRAKLRMVAFYLLIYTENFTMAAFSFYKIYVSQTDFEKLYNFIALPVGFILHISFLVIYYQVFHPKTGMLNKTICR